MLGRCRGAAVAAWCLALFAAFAARDAWAQAGNLSADEVAAARSLFAEALRDEEAKRFLDALQKFQRVRAVRDTPSIEYRIGSCYEGLGRAVPAYVAYRDATVLGQGDVQSAEVVGAAVDRLRALAKHVARLTLALAELVPADVEVRVDGVVVARAALDEAIVIEPGPHLVTATAKVAAPFRSEIVLPEGALGSLTISLEARASSPSGAVATAAPAAEPAVASPAAGWIGVAGGGALLVGSTALLLVRQSEISKLNRECPGGACPPGSNRSDLESTRSRALVEGPVAIGLGVGGVVATGIGAYFLFIAGSTGIRVVPVIAGGAGGVAVAGAFR